MSAHRRVIITTNLIVDESTAQASHLSVLPQVNTTTGHLVNTTILVNTITQATLRSLWRDQSLVSAAHHHAPSVLPVEVT